MEAILSKPAKSIPPGPVADHKDEVKDEAQKVSAKIDAAFEKLAKKMTEQADKAKAKINETKKPAKRAVLLRRFELYADAATHLRERQLQSAD